MGVIVSSSVICSKVEATTCKSGVAIGEPTTTSDSRPGECSTFQNYQAPRETGIFRLAKTQQAPSCCVPEECRRISYEAII